VKKDDVVLEVDSDLLKLYWKRKGAEKNISFMLKKTVKISDIVASMTDGILSVLIPDNKKQIRKIEIT
jgi:HSP20 family molecular chaperone IbpA